ncbi:MAG: hypothetical protein Q8Q20_05750 [bacterium]|nr:hypothetical protein [bacterium]
MKRLFLAVSITALILPQALLAAVFNPNNIISTEELTNNRSMSRDRIQKFLETQTGLLSQYHSNVYGVSKSAAEVIYDAANFYQISPKYLLVLLQKEQSLITDPTPNEGQYDWATGYAVCDSCSKSDPRIQQYRGFFNQVNWAARRNRQYIEEAGRWHFKVGGTYQIDGQTVIMDNQATVNLYTYTPHIHGNQLFHSLWHRWFTTEYPDGTLLQAENKPGVYLIQNGKKRPFWSKSAFLASYNSRNIITVSQTALDAYDDGRPIKFPEYSLLKSPDQKVYLLNGDSKRMIESDEVFRKIGFNPEEVIDVEQSDVDSYLNGEPINAASLYPVGILMQSKQNGGVAFIQNGVRHPIWSKEILSSRFPHHRATIVEQSEIDSYPVGDPITFQDGELVTAKEISSVYVISNGQKRRVGSAEVFNQLGFKWDNIIYTSQKALEIHPEGAVLTVD